VKSKSSGRSRVSITEREISRRERGSRTPRKVRGSEAELGVPEPSASQAQNERSPRRGLVSEGPEPESRSPARSSAEAALPPGRRSVTPGNGSEALSKAETAVLAVLQAAAGELTRAALLARARLRAGDAVAAVNTLIARGLVLREGSGRRRNPFRFRAAEERRRVLT
jgi:hypothetical protein